jgi:hypothetical protein
MKKNTYQNAIENIRIGAKVTMRNPSPVDYIEIGTRGEIIELLGNCLTDPSNTEVVVKWELDGIEDSDIYDLYELPFYLDIH